jgi:membrane protein
MSGIGHHAPSPAGGRKAAFARKIPQWARCSLAFARRVFHRFIADRCLTGASALSYTTIVSLVPLTAIVLVTFAGFPIFGDARKRFIRVILDNFAPDVGEEAVAGFTSFATNAAQTTALGVIALIVTSILLLVTIEEHLHYIFRVTTPRSWGQRVLAYWAVFTLGPVLFGVGLSVSGDVDALVRAVGIDSAVAGHTAKAWSSGFRWLAPVVLETVAVTLLYRLIPNRAIPWRACCIGGFLAAGLLEALKLPFAVFVARLSSYNAVYGALAGIPIFLLWMYIFWCAVLLGAEVTACLTEAAAEIADAAPDRPRGP